MLLEVSTGLRNMVHWGQSAVAVSHGVLIGGREGGTHPDVSRVVGCGFQSIGSAASRDITAPRGSVVIG